ncbi:hypothetical protein GCM10027030_00420 [Luteococcus sediminum]
MGELTQPQAGAVTDALVLAGAGDDRKDAGGEGSAPGAVAHGAPLAGAGADPWVAGPSNFARYGAAEPHHKG